MRLVPTCLFLVFSGLLAGCDRSESGPTRSADAGKPPAVSLAAPQTTVPENLSEPAQQKGEPNDAETPIVKKNKTRKLVYTPAAEWNKIPPCTGVLERFVVKHADEDTEDAMLDIERPTKTTAGIDPIVERWRAAFSGPDGAALPDGAFRSETMDVSGLSVTLVDIRGHHKVPGPAPARPGIQLLGAIIDTPVGFWTFKLLGHERTVENNRAAFLEFVRAAKME